MLRGADTAISHGSCGQGAVFRAGQLYVVGIYVDSTSREITLCVSVLNSVAGFRLQSSEAGEVFGHHKA